MKRMSVIAVGVLLCLGGVADLTKAIGQDADRKAKPLTEENDGLPGIWPGPRREQLEALIRAVGRDPVSDELIERVDVIFRPRGQRGWTYPNVMSLVASKSFVETVDEAARAVTGKPADTLALIRFAATAQNRDDSAVIARKLREYASRMAAPMKTIRGQVRTEESDKPIAGVIVSASGRITRTDAKGRYTLQVPTPWRGYELRVSFESPGRALMQADFPWEEMGEATTCDRQLPQASPFAGRILDSEGKPIADAEVALWVKQTALTPEPEHREKHSSTVNLMTARTDAAGIYAFRNLPHERTEDQIAQRLTVSHPKYKPREKQYERNELLGEGWEITLEPGCVVRGVVVDNDGRPVVRAAVTAPSDILVFSERVVLTDADGRFELGHLPEGSVDVVVRPLDRVMAVEKVDTKRDDPVRVRIVTPKGHYFEGRVIGEDGKPAAGASVGWIEPLNEVLKPGQQAHHANLMTQTRDDGTFLAGPVAKGRYRITALVDPPRAIATAEVETNGKPVVLELKPDRR